MIEDSQGRNGSTCYAVQQSVFRVCLVKTEGECAVRGSVTVEAALVMPLVLLLVIGCVGLFLSTFERMRGESLASDGSGKRNPAEICRIMVVIEEGVEDLVSAWQVP